MLKRSLKLAVVLAMASAAQAAVADDIILFTGGDFGGRQVSLRNDTRDLNQLGFNDRAASLVVQSGTWEVCQHANFGGECRVYQPGQYSNLDRLNGQISSVRLVNAAVGWDERSDERHERRANRRGAREAELVLFDGSNLRGRALPLRGDLGDLVSAGFNDRAQSMKIGGGSWELCQHRDFGGMCRVYGPGEYNLDRQLHRAVSSVRLVSNGRGRGNEYGADTGYGRGRDGEYGADTGYGRGRDGEYGADTGYGRGQRDSYDARGSDMRREGGVELFSGAGFGGQRVPVRDDVRTLDMMNFNDRAASLVVFAGEWEFCQHADFRGQCMTYGPGRYERLGSLHNGISSIRRVR